MREKDYINVLFLVLKGVTMSLILRAMWTIHEIHFTRPCGATACSCDQSAKFFCLPAENMRTHFASIIVFLF